MSCAITSTMATDGATSLVVENMMENADLDLAMAVAIAESDEVPSDDDFKPIPRKVRFNQQINSETCVNSRPTTKKKNLLQRPEKTQDRASLVGGQKKVPKGIVKEGISLKSHKYGVNGTIELSFSQILDQFRHGRVGGVNSTSVLGKMVPSTNRDPNPPGLRTTRAGSTVKVRYPQSNAEKDPRGQSDTVEMEDCIVMDNKTQDEEELGDESQFSVLLRLCLEESLADGVGTDSTEGGQDPILGNRAIPVHRTKYTSEVEETVVIGENVQPRDAVEIVESITEGGFHSTSMIETGSQRSASISPLVDNEPGEVTSGNVVEMCLTHTEKSTRLRTFQDQTCEELRDGNVCTMIQHGRPHEKQVEKFTKGLSSQHLPCRENKYNISCVTTQQSYPTEQMGHSKARRASRHRICGDEADLSSMINQRYLEVEKTGNGSDGKVSQDAGNTMSITTQLEQVGRFKTRQPLQSQLCEANTGDTQHVISTQCPPVELVGNCSKGWASQCRSCEDSRIPPPCSPLEQGNCSKEWALHNQTCEENPGDIDCIITEQFPPVEQMGDCNEGHTSQGQLYEDDFGDITYMMTQYPVEHVGDCNKGQIQLCEDDTDDISGMMTQKCLPLEQVGSYVKGQALLDHLFKVSTNYTTCIKTEQCPRLEDCGKDRYPQDQLCEGQDDTICMLAQESPLQLKQVGNSKSKQVLQIHLCKEETDDRSCMINRQHHWSEEVGKCIIGISEKATSGVTKQSVKLEQVDDCSREEAFSDQSRQESTGNAGSVDVEHGLQRVTSLGSVWTPQDEASQESTDFRSMMTEHCLPHLQQIEGPNRISSPVPGVDTHKQQLLCSFVSQASEKRRSDHLPIEYDVDKRKKEKLIKNPVLVAHEVNTLVQVDHVSKITNDVDLPCVPNIFRRSQISEEMRPKSPYNEKMIPRNDEVKATIHYPVCGANLNKASGEWRVTHTNFCLDRIDTTQECLEEKGVGGVGNVSFPIPGSDKVRDWLEILNLSRYASLFMEQEIDWDTLQWLKEGDLLAMGITSLGPRRKILSALQEIKIGCGASRTEPPLTPAAPGPVAENASRKLQLHISLADSTSRTQINRDRSNLITNYFPLPPESGKQPVHVRPVTYTAQRSLTGMVKNRAPKRPRNSAYQSPSGIPPWKCIPGTPFRVDAFQHMSGDCAHWFLTHFHTDHYQGLTRGFRHGQIYCSLITARLVNLRIGVSWEQLMVIPLGEKFKIAGVDVTFIDANHCPGSVMILFEPPSGEAVLHTGDFRFCTEMTNNLLLRSTHIHTLILDTTYCDPQYDFPTQETVIQFVIDAIQAEAFNSDTLFLIGTYTIGKERIFLEVGKALKKFVFVGAAKKKLLECMDLPLGDTQWLTCNEHESSIHVVPLWSISNFKRMNSMLRHYHGKYKLIVAFSPTGWSFGRGKKKTPGKRWQQGTMIRYEVPYSEHSSYPELREFLKFIDPEDIIPSVPGKSGTSAETMIASLWTQFK